MADHLVQCSDGATCPIRCRKSCVDRTQIGRIEKEFYNWTMNRIRYYVLWNFGIDVKWKLRSFLHRLDICVLLWELLRNLEHVINIVHVSLKGQMSENNIIDEFIYVRWSIKLRYGEYNNVRGKIARLWHSSKVIDNPRCKELIYRVNLHLRRQRLLQVLWRRR